MRRGSAHSNCPHDFANCVFMSMQTSMNGYLHLCTHTVIIYVLIISIQIHGDKRWHSTWLTWLGLSVCRIFLGRVMNAAYFSDIFDDGDDDAAPAALVLLPARPAGPAGQSQAAAAEEQSRD